MGTNGPPPSTSVQNLAPLQQLPNEPHVLRYHKERNLIVNYLPQNYTDRALFDMFACFGPLDSVKIMRDPTSGYSYGFGFVNFTKEADAKEAIKFLNGKWIGGKSIKVSVARPPSDDIKDTNLYISNLSTEITEEELGRLFQPFGEIVHLKLIRDKFTGLPTGSGFVRFSLREQAISAIHTMNNCMLPGASQGLFVKLAHENGKHRAAYLAGFQDALYKRSNPNFVKHPGYSGKSGI